VIYAKSLTIGEKVTTFKVESSTSPKLEASMELKALYALLGGYNEVARNIDVDDFHKIQEKFRAAHMELAFMMLEANLAKK